MTNKIGDYDYDTLHVLQDDKGVVSLFESRSKRIVVTPDGQPVTVVPDDAGLSYIMDASMNGNQIVNGNVLIRVTQTADEEA